MKRVAQIILSLILVFIFIYSPAVSAADPNPKDNYILADFMKNGVKAYYMGNQLGYNGWFLAKDNQVQVAYTSLDNKSIVIGVMFDSQGANITSQQIKALYDNNSEVHAFLTNLNQGQNPIGPGQQQNAGMPQMGQFAGMQPTQGITPSANTTMPFMPTSPGERLMKALQDAAGVNMGAQTAPKLYMIADPNCPHCQATWKMLRPAIMSGKLQIRLVPIDALSADSARASAQFLRSANPLDAWDKYIQGDQSQLAGTPDATSVAAIHANHELLDAWHITATPYMVYRGKDGQVKILEGEPQQGAAMIDDIAP